MCLLPLLCTLPVLDTLAVAIATAHIKDGARILAIIDDHMIEKLCLLDLVSQRSWGEGVKLRMCSSELRHDGGYEGRSSWMGRGVGVTAAAQIEVFASHTSGRIKDISEKLVIVIDNTDTKAVADSRKRIKVLLDRLQVDANNIKVKSDKLRIDLDKWPSPKFDKITLVDRTNLIRVDAELVASQTVFAAEIKAAKKKNQDEIDDARKPTTTKALRDTIGFLDTLFSWETVNRWDLFDAKAFSNRMVDEHKVLWWTDLVLEAEQKGITERFSSVSALTSVLVHLVSDVKSAIDGALAAVINISGASAVMQTGFQDIAELIDYVREEDLEDLKNLVDGWERVEFPISRPGPPEL
ncbi:hypothetical protein Q9L58_008919 [Maublancomyces gigas]|uniref:Uncharacterized protein n=1 Tax=Discina gigas TaxID=1032678 RepID=A0ABR3G8E0_9PEZI